MARTCAARGDLHSAPANCARMLRATLFLFASVSAWTPTNSTEVYLSPVSASRVSLRGAPPCPVASSVSGIDLANAAVHLLTLDGRLEEAIACNSLLLAGERGGESLPSEAREAVSGNQGALKQALAPWRSGVPRLYHTINGSNEDWPPHSDTPLVKPRANGRPWGPDKAIQVWDDALTEDECEDIISLFERSELFQGNVVSNGQCVAACTPATNRSPLPQILNAHSPTPAE